MHAPVIVYGDVKIVFYSYEKLVLKEQFVCGFNTRALAYDQTMITLEKGDLYEGQLIGNRVHVSDHSNVDSGEQLLWEVWVGK